MSPAKQAPVGQGAPPVAAGARLTQMRRRVRLGRMGVWAAVAAGPIALAVAVTAPATVVHTAAEAKPTRVRTPVPANPAGYAGVFLTAWLRSSRGDDSSAQARLAQSLAPEVDLPERGDAQPKLESVVAVRSAQRSGQRWSVTLAAQYAEAGVRYYVVPVAADSSGTTFTVTGAPGVVAGPARAQAARSPYRVTVPTTGDLSLAAGEFLAAYVTGSGEVDRYLAPGVKLSAVSPAPYEAVTVTQLDAIEEAAAAEQVPADGTRVRVAAQVEARDKAGRWPLSYELTFTARSGRWEVAALASGVTVQEGGVRS
ncbi:conjugal transfer protein [Streptomyces sp. NPDC002896]|uniref:conjugal transfer protein n=1 Tax=Streptomyces sp. NPDC002896 TaxID=3154438 RepID=UPI003331DC99